MVPMYISKLNKGFTKYMRMSTKILKNKGSR